MRSVDWRLIGERFRAAAGIALLAVAFYGVLSPVALLRRLFGADPLAMRRPKSTDSYWIEREPSAPDRLRDQF